MKHFFSIMSLAAILFAAASAQDSATTTPAPAKKGFKRPPRPGVKTAGVQHPMSELTPKAVFPVEGVPDWQVVTEDAVWVSNKPKNTSHRLDATTNQVVATITVGQKPCSGLTAGFGSIWVPNCGDNTLSRVDMKTNTVVATIPVGPAHTEGGVAASDDAVWILSDPKGKLSRVDPKTNTVVAEVAVPEGSFACTYADEAIWVSSTEKSQVVRVDPKTNKVTDVVDVGPQPRLITAGAGAVWTLNQGDGTISRVDTKTRKLVTNIECGIPGGGGEISYGGGHVWATVFQIPLTKIDVETNQVVAQWTGPGGDAVRFGHGSVWLSNLREQNLWRLSPAP
jgi:virginiamycin B lyase